MGQARNVPGSIFDGQCVRSTWLDFVQMVRSALWASKSDVNFRAEGITQSIPRTATNLPSAQAYDPPTPPLQKDVGPPPPGYGRYHLYDPLNPAHWQVWAGIGGSSGGRFGYNGGHNAPQAIPSNIDEAARSAAVNMAQRMGLRDIPDDGGRAQGGNLWRYTAMVEKGLIKPPSEGGKGWKSADELRTVTCYVSLISNG